MKSQGIERQMLLVALVPIALFAMLMAGYSIFMRFADLDREELERSRLVVHQLASSSEYAVFSHNSILLSRDIEVALAQQDVRKVAVLDASANLLLGAGVVPATLEKLLSRANPQTPVYQDSDVLVLYEPIFATEINLGELEQSPDAGKKLGAVVLEISKRRLNEQKNQILIFDLLATALILIGTLMVALQASRRISKPVKEICHAVHLVGEGELDINVVPQNHVHELDELAKGINQMARQLQQDRNKLEERIAEVTKGLREKVQEAEQAHAEKANLNKKLERALDELKAIMEANPDILYVFDLKGRLIQWNSSFEKFCGLAHEQMMSRPATEFVRAEDREAMKKAVMEVFEKGAATMEVQLVRHDGVTVPYLCNGVVLRNPGGEVIGFTGAGRDISEREVAAENMRRMAHYDALTGLPNRVLLSDRLHQALTAAKRDKSRLAVMFVDLDFFKPINDTLGHYIGDLLLKEVSKRMHNCLRESDTAARIGGDEFVVMLPAIETEEVALAVAEKIRASLSQPFELAGHSLHISSSIGVAVYPEHGSEERALLKNADNAMYYAKKDGRNNVKLCMECLWEGNE
jgi:diguanylate cyclase (GGDEF)-like protein/PAS domain S-box-containing protein